MGGGGGEGSGGFLTACSPKFALDGRGIYYAEGTSVLYARITANEEKAIPLITHSFNVTTLNVLPIEAEAALRVLSTSPDAAELRIGLANAPKSEKSTYWTLLVTTDESSQLHFHLHPLSADKKTKHSVTRLGSIPLNSTPDREETVETPRRKKARTSTPQTTSTSLGRVVTADGTAKGTLCLGIVQGDKTVIYKLETDRIIEAYEKSSAVAFDKIATKVVDLPGTVFLSAIAGKSLLAAVSVPVSNQRQDNLYFVDLAHDLASKLEIPPVTNITGLAIHPHGRQACFSDAEGCLWWVAKKKKSNVHFTSEHWHDHGVSGITFSVDGDVTHSVDEKGVLATWAGLDQSGLSRTVLRDLGAPALRVVAPCAQMARRYPKELEKIRPYVIICLSSNVLRVIDTSSLSVKLELSGLQTVCRAPEDFARLSQKRIVQNEQATWAPPTASYFLSPVDAESDSDETFVLSPIFTAQSPHDSAVLNSGTFSLVSARDGRLESIGSLAYTQRQEWSRQEGLEWQAAWRARQAAFCSDGSGFAVSESQMVAKNKSRHRVRFFVPQRDRYICTSVIDLDAPATVLLDCTKILNAPTTTYMLGTTNGNFGIWRERKLRTKDVLVYEAILRQRLFENLPVNSLNLTATGRLYVTTESTAFVFQLDVERLLTQPAGAVRRLEEPQRAVRVGGSGSPKGWRVGKRRPACVEAIVNAFEAAEDGRFFWVASNRHVEVWGEGEATPTGRWEVPEEFALTQLESRDGRGVYGVVVRESECKVMKFEHKIGKIEAEEIGDFSGNGGTVRLAIGKDSLILVNSQGKYRVI